jgi:ribosomal protein S18 acetylase RimI-like enzyme
METIISKRTATESDTDFVHQTECISYKDVVVRQFGSWDDEKHNELFNKTWKPEKYEILSSNGTDCGFISIERNKEYIFIHEIVLLPEFQGKGIGSSLVKEIIQEASLKNIPVRLQVLKENQAQHLYRKLGFKDTGVTDTHFKMELKPSS